MYAFSNAGICSFTSKKLKLPRKDTNYSKEKQMLSRKSSRRS
jgi:hypothetical protein